QMESERKTWESTWQEISENLLGRRDFQTQYPVGGRQRLENIYDGTGMQAHDEFVAMVSSLLTNPATEWFLLATAVPQLMEIPSVAAWVQDAQDHLRFVINRPGSGFQPQMHEMYNDLIGWGTGGIAVLEDPVEGLYFHAHNLQELFLDEDSRGRVNAVFRKTRMTARQVEEKYPGKSGAAARHMKSKNENQKIVIVQAIFPNNEAHLGGIGNFPFASAHIAIDEGAPEKLMESGFYEMPILTPRWSKDTGEFYGRSPGVNALPDGKMANQMNKSVLKAGQKAIDPAILIGDRGVLSTVRTHAGGYTSVRFDGNRRGPIEALESRAQFQIGLELLESRQRAIEQKYHANILEIFRKSNMTATEIIELAERVDRSLSPVLGRQQEELLNPLVNRAFSIEMRAGRMPPPPPELVGQTVIVEYQSPVARAQKASEKRALREGVAGALEVASAAPEVLDNYDLDAIARLDWRLGGLPVEGMRSPEAVAALREQRAQQVAAQQQLEAGLAIADAESKFNRGGRAA
ncbi:MAG: portal protein, partial [Hyphomicrobium sp.]